MTKKYDAVIIGAGMSGLAAGIRLAMFEKNVLILERHNISGGLNSYYKRGKREFDVGLHALTNFAGPKDRQLPLGKLLKQLRIPYESLELSEQNHSLIHFPEQELKFTNDINVFLEEVAQKFPAQIDNLRRLIEKIKNFNEVSLENEFLPAKVVVRQFISDESLVEMIFCPLLIYGSAWENDMDFSQFVIMFKSIFLEGFSRPKGGVRTILNLLKDRYEKLGGEIRFKTGVKQILSEGPKITSVILDNDEQIDTENILSSAGLPETLAMCQEGSKRPPRTGNLSFTESILITEKKPSFFKQDATIIFYNNRPHYTYQKSVDYIDAESAVICFPNNFKFDESTEGVMRVTNIANYDKWQQLPRPEYLTQKDIVFKNAQKTLQKFLPGFNGDFLFKDIFSPTTVKRYTGHFGGAVYGSPDKSRNGKTHLNGLYIMGTDQGFLGIVDTMLSGISIANLYGLLEQK